jgi:hypothetical protein
MRHGKACVRGVCTFIAGAALLWPGHAARASILYNEALSGDLSDNHLAPSTLNLLPGVSSFFGVMSGFGPGETYDRDYYRVTVPEGYALTSLTLDLYASLNYAAFLGVVRGPVVSAAPESASPEDMLGYVVFDQTMEGSDLLPIMGANGIGFTGALPAGTYTFWGQQIDDYTEYNLTFTVTAVPGPGAAGALACAGVWAGCRRRRR